MPFLTELPPLALYIHIPWCLQKCPYCDFNSHAAQGKLNEKVYIDAMLRDLDADLTLVKERELISIFIGGGTPSLFSGKAISSLLDGIKSRLSWIADIEITIEANPGTVDSEHFKAYRRAGINRLSIGAQSFSREHLQALGRIHGPEENAVAVDAARSAGFDNLNLDIMYGLPGQTLEAAIEDVSNAISLQPEHISYYQLTIEPNTRFHAAPPVTPEDDLLWDIETKGRELLDRSGYRQYEVSAFARTGYECKHNRNYWEFGDYLGIGAGAHGKISNVSNGQILRTRKPKSPDSYFQYAESPNLTFERVPRKDLLLEFMLNALRLKHGFHPSLIQRRIGIPWCDITAVLDTAEKNGLLAIADNLIIPTPKGREFLNELVGLFIPSE